MSKWDSPQCEGQAASLDRIMKKEVCKPDYESMILVARKNSQDIKNFMSAIENFVLSDVSFSTGDLKDLYGHLHFKYLNTQVAIASIIKQQEESN